MMSTVPRTDKPRPKPGYELMRIQSMSDNLGKQLRRKARKQKEDDDQFDKDLFAFEVLYLLVIMFLGMIFYAFFMH